MAKLKRRYAELTGDWQTLQTRVVANLGELPELEPFVVRLGALMDQVQTVVQRQGAMRAAKQEASKEVQTLIKQANRLVDLIRTGLRERYGPTSEKLAEFGLQPFRGLDRQQSDTGEPDGPPPGSPPVE